MTLLELNVWLDYNYWARDVVLDAVAPLSSEQFTRPIESSFKSVRATLGHIYFAEWIWYMRWIGEAPPPASRPSVDSWPHVASLRSAWSELEGKVRAFVNSEGE